MRTGILLISGMLTLQSSFGQNSKISEQLSEQGKKFLEAENYRQAAQLYQDAVAADSSNLQANLMAAISLLNFSGSEALPYLYNVYQADSSLRPDIHYLIGLSLQKGYRFQDALDHFYFYLEQPGDGSNFPSAEDARKRISECETGIEFTSKPRPIEIINLGKKINSEFADYGPVVDPAESIIIFTSRRKEGNLNPSIENGYYFEDIYFSTQKDSSWTSAMNVGIPVNTPYHESVICLSAEGDQLYLYKDVGEGDVYISSLSDDGWTEPVPLQVVNSPYSERSLTISPNKDTIIFSSNRPGGLGGFDLYLTSYDGKYWSRPINMGPNINTIEDDDSPALDPAQHVLYFSSKGWDGMGGFDIYASDLRKEIKPINLGYPVNTPEDDIYFMPVVAGDVAYFSSARSEGYGNLDIYLLKSLDGKILPLEEESNETIIADTYEINRELSMLFFEFGKTKLIEASEEILRQNIEILKENPSDHITLIGHTDNVGSETENSILAMDRAMKVAILLKQNGISEERISLEARGECCPIVPNEDQAKVYMNRRVEFRVKQD